METPSGRAQERTKNKKLGGEMKFKRWKCKLQGMNQMLTTTRKS